MHFEWAILRLLEVSKLRNDRQYRGSDVDFIHLHLLIRGSVIRTNVFVNIDLLTMEHKQHY